MDQLSIQSIVVGGNHEDESTQVSFHSENGTRRNRCHEQKHEITNYVLQENSSLIQAEIAALRSLFKFLDTFSPEGYESLEALAEGVLAKFKELIKKKEYPQALYFLIERRVQKVVKYLAMA